MLQKLFLLSEIYIFFGEIKFIMSEYFRKLKSSKQKICFFYVYLWKYFLRSDAAVELVFLYNVICEEFHLLISG